MPPERLRHDCALDAFGIAGAVLAADGRQSDDELWELAAAFGPHLETQIAGATPADIRRSGVIDGLADHLARPTPLFQLLVDVDRARGTRHARTYYDRGLAVAFGIGAALFASSAFFAILHPQLPLGFLPIAVLGAVFAGLYEWRQSLVPGMVAHAINNAVAFAMLNLVFPLGR